MASKGKSSAPAVKAFPNLKTIISKENDLGSVKSIERPGVWKRSLDQEIVLNEGDTVTLKSSYVQNTTAIEGFITIEPDEMAALSLETGMYWCDAGCGESKYIDVVPVTASSGVPGVLPNWDKSTMVQPPLNSIRQSSNGAAPETPAGANNAVFGGGKTYGSIVADPTKAPDGRKYILCNKQDQVARLELSLDTAVNVVGATAMTIQLNGNSNYKPHVPGTGQFWDYSIGSGTTVHVPVTGATPIKLDNVGYIVDMKLTPVVSTQGGSAPKWHVYSANAHWNTVTPFPTPQQNMYIATATVTTDANARSVWSIVANENWTPNLTIGENALDGWVFEVNPASSPVIFEYTPGSALYRVCVGFWLWGIFPGRVKKKPTVPPRDETFPAVGRDGTRNSYGFRLNYFGRGVDPETGESTSVKRHNQVIYFDTANNDRLNVPWTAQLQQYSDEFASFGGGTGSHGPQINPPAPDSVFPSYHIFDPKNGARIPVGYPATQTGFRLTPVYFGGNPDVIDPGNGKIFEPFTYDAAPQTTHTDGRAAAYSPFTITNTMNWVDGKEEYRGYETSGFIPQDINGQIQSNYPKGQGLPPMWADSVGTYKPDIVPSQFAFKPEQVVSLPYIPGDEVLFTARTYKTKLLDVPGCTLDPNGGTYTYSEWAKLLTDNLNRMPKVIGGVSNNPEVSGQPLNPPTYSESRLLTDTAQLCYQGEVFPNTNVGLPFKGLTYQGAAQEFLRQPYWVSTDGQEIFQFNNTAVIPGQVSLPPNTVLEPGGLNIPTMGSGGARWVGAESVSFDFNEESSSFEILQMHSNLYDAASGAVVTRQYRSNPDTVGTDPPTNLFGTGPSDIGSCATVSQQGGIYITNWEPTSVWQDKMNLNGNTLVAVDTNTSQVNMAKGDWATTGLAIGLDRSTTDIIPLVEGLHCTGNYVGQSAAINKAPNISTTPGTGATGGQYNNINVGWNTISQISTPVTIPGRPIIAATVDSPFYQVEVSGIGKNEIYGQDTKNSLIAGVVGRYFTQGGFTEGSLDGSISYVHRGRPLLLRELAFRILDAEGNEFGVDGAIGIDSAVILEINSSIDSIEYTPPPPNTGI